MASFLRDNDDLQYYLGEGIDWETVVSVSEMGYRFVDGFKTAAEGVAFYREIAEMVGQFVAEEIAPHAAEIDREGVRFAGGEATFPPRLAGIFRQLGELGLHGMNLPRELGGMNAPMLLYFVNAELLARADASVMAHHGFHGGTAMAMLVLSMLEGTTEHDPATGRITRTRWAKEIAEIASGEAWGSMDITESDAGSDMAALRATGEQDAAGNWTLTGQKIFITSGHGKYHFVVARTEAGGSDGAADGAKGGLHGLSMFMVPAFADGPDGRRTRLAGVDRVEEKLGQHGSATVAITFDRTPAELVGRRGDGFRLMLEIMNHARLGVGFESIGLCEAALRLARAYAAERRSMGKSIDRHEMIADYLDEMESDIVGLRALAMHGAFHEEMAHKKALFGKFMGGARDVEVRAHRAAARRTMPLLKYLAAEKAVEMARRCLQIHGGNGYMREFGAEKLLRDALVMPIYEGTSQIQALMAMKDTLTGIMKAPQDFVLRMAQTRWRSLSARDALERRVARLQLLSLGAQQHLMTRTMAAKVRTVQGRPLGTWRKALFEQWNPKRDFAYALLHAERLTRLLADEAIAEVLLGQARRHPARRQALTRHLERAEPRARFLHDEITSTGQRLIEALAGAGAGAGASASAGVEPEAGSAA
ncbi:MAG TPA: acyl-CoA dehydrogenase family protein [Polyangia bacterium]|nr:acyl-CoA dehydrogenase family protein [Polyangia bacterium]